MRDAGSTDEIKPPPIRWEGKTAAQDVGPVAKLPMPSWAKGCGECDCGLLAPPKPLGALPMYVERRAQFMAGALTFCTCKAGQLYRAYLVMLSQRQPEEM
jgi:hypothetical protein